MRRSVGRVATAAQVHPSASPSPSATPCRGTAPRRWVRADRHPSVATIPSPLPRGGNDGEPTFRRTSIVVISTVKASLPRGATPVGSMTPGRQPASPAVRGGGKVRETGRSQRVGASRDHLGKASSIGFPKAGKPPITRYPPVVAGLSACPGGGSRGQVRVSDTGWASSERQRARRARSPTSCLPDDPSLPRPRHGFHDGGEPICWAFGSKGTYIMGPAQER